jgi:hypothetical protein
VLVARGVVVVVTRGGAVRGVGVGELGVVDVVACTAVGTVATDIAGTRAACWSI